MKDFIARFRAPLFVARPRGSRLLEACSPTLGRRVQFFDRTNFALWIRLESDPTVISFCERPVRLGPSPGDRCIDFWAQRQDGETMLVLDSEPGESVPQSVQGIPVQIVAPSEMAAASTWVLNWERMLPVINATRRLIPAELSKAILDSVRQPVSLARVEQERSAGDPSLVRGAIFELLRSGRISAPSLHTQPLTLHTLLEPVS